MHRFSRLTSDITGLTRRFVSDESGATAIEYAMIATGIGVAVLAAVTALGTATDAKYESIVTAVK